MLRTKKCVCGGGGYLKNFAKSIDIDWYFEQIECVLFNIRSRSINKLWNLGQTSTWQQKQQQELEQQPLLFSTRKWQTLLAVQFIGSVFPDVDDCLVLVQGKWDSKWSFCPPPSPPSSSSQPPNGTNSTSFTAITSYKTNASYTQAPIQNWPTLLLTQIRSQPNSTTLASFNSVVDHHAQISQK